jgi:hypothetical protein
MSNKRTFPYFIVTNGDNEGHDDEQRAWCEELWGKPWCKYFYPESTWDQDWLGWRDKAPHVPQYEWQFKTKEQRNWFALRWL